ncbi:MAG: SHOCT domain-containing protein [Dehalococcoidia bacterium]
MNADSSSQRIIEEIGQLKRLADIGAITPDEFEERKRQRLAHLDALFEPTPQRQGTPTTRPAPHSPNRVMAASKQLGLAGLLLVGGYLAFAVLWLLADLAYAGGLWPVGAMIRVISWATAIAIVLGVGAFLIRGCVVLVKGAKLNVS